MKDYLEIRNRERIKSVVLGLTLTAAIHVGAASYCVFKGLTYLWPPPPESSFLIDFTEEEEKVPEVKITHKEPQSEQPDPETPVKVVKVREASVAAAVETTKEPEIDQNALFPGMATPEPSDAAPTSAPPGNSTAGPAKGQPNAHLEGRDVIQGWIATPKYNVQESGTVVVKIWVNNYGVVISAVPGGEGTTVTDRTLWEEARKAALKTRFEPSAEAPSTQEGTITYIFTLK